MESLAIPLSRRNNKIDPIINRLRDNDGSSILSASSSVAGNNNADAFLNELKEELKEEQQNMLKQGNNTQSMPIISTTSVVSETSQYEVPISFSGSMKLKQQEGGGR